MGLTGTELQPAPQDEVGRRLMHGLPKPFPVDPKALAAYAGRCQFDDFDVTIRVDGARIYLRVPGGEEAELIAIS